MNVFSPIASFSDPASRYRILQYRHPLAKEGIHLHCRSYKPERNTDPPGWMIGLRKFTGINEWRINNLIKIAGRLPLLIKQSQYDLIWQNRLILPFSHSIEKKWKKPFVFDFDDAIWINEGEKQTAAAFREAAMVIAGNDFLAEYASAFTSRIRIIPTVVDTNALYPLEKKDQPFTIGWIGSAGNINYLEPVKPAILEFLRLNPDARFVLVSSAPGNLFPFDGQRIIFRPWTPESENELINSFSVGLMPLPDTEYSKGKCSFKMLQYMACAVPVLVSPVGTNKKILNESQSGLSATDTSSWLAGLQTLRSDFSLYAACSGNGPAYTARNYSLKEYTPVMAALLHELSGK